MCRERFFQVFFLILLRFLFKNKVFLLFKTLVALILMIKPTLLPYFQINIKFVIQNSRYYFNNLIISSNVSTKVTGV